MKLVWYTALAVIALLFTGTLYAANQLSQRIDRLEQEVADHLPGRIERLELVKHTEVAAFVKGLSVLCGHQDMTQDLFDFDATQGADLYTANLNGVTLVTRLKDYGLRPEKSFCENELSQFITQNGL
ncbi:hypothetical protein [Roseibium sp. MMSF_3412]|uniref:hypothetical protein n=1 Tax=Roseibium sp. MMSF_3412 TaxID=3046712 RepID=UPI00273F701B|nr:hypothetical protein [Roseibium sp. MMSF_3412]